jgi:hypothetical protein
MKPRRTVVSTRVYRLEGGTEDNDLWVTDYPGEPEGEPSVIGSTWELTADEREQISNGANIELLVWGGQPPVALRLSTYTLGKASA